MKTIRAIFHEITGKHKLSFEEMEDLANLNTRVFFAGGQRGNDKIPELTTGEYIEIENRRQKIRECSCGVIKNYKGEV